MTGISVEVTGMGELVARLQFLNQNTGAQVEQAVMGSADDAKGMAQSLSPVRTGYFKSRWQTRAVALLQYELLNDASYAAPLIFGHRTRGGRSFVPGRDCLTPALTYGRGQLLVRLQAVASNIGR